MNEVLVTLADENYVEQAKQLFSSVYWNSGWKGDYLLLSCDIPERELGWFRDRGIIVKKCDPIVGEVNWINRFPRSVLAKFYLFTPEFRKWDRVIFLDGDIIVRSSLDKLLNLDGFWGGDNTTIPLNKEFKLYTPKRLLKDYNLNSIGFCSGVMSFTTNIIKDDDFDKLVRLTDDYGEYCVWGEQGILNLFFYNKFRILPYTYNLFVNYWSGKIQSSRFDIEAGELNGVIMHFLDFPKPWDEKSDSYDEWNLNLFRAKEINLSERVKGRKLNSLAFFRAELYFRILKFLRLSELRLHYSFGVVGELIRNYDRDFYFQLKKNFGFL